MVKEFREFIERGNLVEFAVAFIMGAAFAALTASFVENLVMPIIAIPFGEPNFDALTMTINDSVIRYGAFLTALVVFVMTAAAVFFFIVKPYNAYRQRTQPAPEPEPGPSEVELLVEIRDALRR